MITYNNHVLMIYNYYNKDTAHRPEIQQGRTGVRIVLGENTDEFIQLAELHSPYGMVNVSAVDILGDLYLSYSTSQLALEYQNGNPKVRGKDSIRYIKLGYLMPEE